MDNSKLEEMLLAEFNDYIEIVENDETQSIDSETQVQIESHEAHEAKEDEIQNQRRIPMRIVWIEGRRPGRLVWDEVDHNLYYRDGERKEFNAEALKCKTENCDARMYITKDGQAFRLRNSIAHTHGSMYSIYKETMLFNWMKKRCETAPASASNYNIYEEAVEL